MKISKQYLKQIIKEELNLLSEARQQSAAELKSLNKLGLDIYAVISKQTIPDLVKDGMQNGIYRYITNYHESYDEVMSYNTDPSKKAQKDQIVKWYQNFKNQMKSIAEGLGWEYSDSGMWTQFTKPFQGNYQHGTDNFKEYITFKRGKEYYTNLQKLSTLLKVINETPTKGKVSFKIATHFFIGYQQKDNVVIHCKEESDLALIKNKISQVGFDTVDRASLGRSESGVDTGGTSDSDVIAKQVTDEIIKQKAAFLKYLSNPPDSQEFKKGLSGIQALIDAFMERSPHRNK